MHNRSNPTKLNNDLTEEPDDNIITKVKDDSIKKNDLLKELKKDLRESLVLACQAGIRNDQIILDPGIGFGKTYEENLFILKHLDELKSLGFPCLLGASRKSVIGLTLDLPVSERLEGTIITTVMAVISGYSFVRVHDIKANKRSIQMAEAIWTK
jgi:dihydropteroate synthase